LESLAVGLKPTEAMVVGRLTNNFPLVVEIDALPAGYPATGATRSFWPVVDEDGAETAA
jgi:hypothetical protein